MLCIFHMIKKNTIQCSLKCTSAGLLGTHLKISCKNLNSSASKRHSFLVYFFYMQKSGCTWNHFTKLTGVICFGIHSVKLLKRRLGKLDNLFRFLMLIGQKVINFHALRVASFACVHNQGCVWLHTECSIIMLLF